MREEGVSAQVRRLRVAIAEDDDELRWALEQALRGEGFEVLSFEDGSELFDFFALEGNAGADVVVADLHMPGRSGLDGLEEARARGFSAPIFVVTGEGNSELRERVAKLGNALFLQKPLDASLLAQAIHRVAALGRQR
jgi:FixJ family two-component response regulator